LKEKEKENEELKRAMEELKKAKIGGTGNNEVCVYSSLFLSTSLC